MTYAASRNPEHVKFYNSAGWKRTRATKLAAIPWCEYIRPGQTDVCGELAQHVHHIDPIATPTGWEHRLDPTGLMSVCIPCHNRVEAEGPQLPFVAGTLDLSEDDTYYFDAEAGERPIRFIEKFICHYEGKELAGKPFLLHPIQKKIINEVYGYKDRVTHLRRFSRVWWEGAVGCGKSPTLAAIGVFELVAGGEPANQLFCMASNYTQAKVIFEAAKKFIRNSPQLDARCEVTQYEIRCPSSGAVWRIISGKGPKAGERPGAVFGDECHQWVSGDTYHDIQGRMTKRSEPIFWIATNAAAAENRFGIYGQLHEEAIKLLAGKKKDEQLYPIVWASDSKQIDDPAAWKQANPLIGTTVKEDKIRQECERSKGSPSLEARFKRLYLGQQTYNIDTWIDIEARWKPNIKAFEIPKDAALYVGGDFSLGDDLCSIAYVYVTPTIIYVDTHHWICRDVADGYEAKNQIPYSKWAETGDITLVDELVIDANVRKRMAEHVLAHGKIEQFCFDRAYEADQVKVVLEAAGVKCTPIGQGWGTSTGVAELNNRLKSSTIEIRPNAVLDFCAENAQLKSDDRGNSWIIKPNATKRYAGTRWKKVDGLTSLVCALVEARKHSFPKKEWNGGVWLI